MSAVLKKKSLGQHFLHNRHYLGMVADAIGNVQGETVVEIGPGEGALTQVLLERGAKIVALEKDSRLTSVLQEKFAKEIKSKKFTVIEGDALEFEPSNHKLVTNGYKLVGNIPYYITGALFKKFLSAKTQPSTLAFLTQKEVAERIARTKKESILSLSVKAYGTPKYVKTVPAGAFVPPPKVDSAVLLVSSVSRDNFKNAAHEARFFELLKAGFSQKRKKLSSNLRGLLGADYASVLQNTGISPNARAEDVSLEQWLELSSAAR